MSEFEREEYEQVTPQIETPKRVKFTEEQRQRIFDGIRGGNTVREIADEMGVDVKKVAAFKHNNSAAIKEMLGLNIDGTPKVRIVKNPPMPERKVELPVLIENAMQEEETAQIPETEPQEMNVREITDKVRTETADALRAMTAAIEHLEQLIEQGSVANHVLEIAETLIEELRNERTARYGELIDWNDIADRIERGNA